MDLLDFHPIRTGSLNDVAPVRMSSVGKRDSVRQFAGPGTSLRHEETNDLNSVPKSTGNDLSCSTPDQYLRDWGDDFVYREAGYFVRVDRTHGHFSDPKSSIRKPENQVVRVAISRIDPVQIDFMSRTRRDSGVATL